MSALRASVALVLATSLTVGCTERQLIDDGGVSTPTTPAGTTRLERTVQRSGDPEAGWDYLRYGDYIGSGVPADIFTALIGGEPPNRLGREGDSASIPYVFNRFETPTGVDVVGGLNCFGCHSSYLNGEFIVGLGDAFSDFTSNQTGQFEQARELVEFRYGEDSAEAEAYAIFLRGASAAATRTTTPFRGVNSAFLLEEAVARQRNADLSWSDEPVFDLAPRLVASDVPAWWNVKKKAALYYSGIGRGDFARLLQQISVVGVYHAEQADGFDANFPDVLAWIETLEPPVFPDVDTLDPEVVERGHQIFEATCSGCHGTYNEVHEYPNLLVDADVVGTDPVYAEAIAASGLSDWYNTSWFGDYGAAAGDSSYVQPAVAYVAPPLDGVWATAPYLHNGSVPNLMTLLDSSRRPTFWRRDFQDSTYDTNSVGWPHQVVEAGLDVDTYDTTIPGYGNQGHTFGDHLDDDERRALVDYLKTL